MLSSFSTKASIVCRYNYKTINIEIEAIDRLLYTLSLPHSATNSVQKLSASVKSLAVLAKSSSTIVVVLFDYFVFVAV